MPSTHGSWRDHTVEILHCDPTTTACVYTQPLRAAYLQWLDSFRKSLGALLYSWIIAMALDLEFERGKYQPLVHGT
eukprot:1969343-Rhodomonas_salina.1